MDTGNSTSLEKQSGFYISRSLTAFLIASLLVFTSVALFERQMYRNLGRNGAYAVWILLFIVGGGGLLAWLTQLGRRIFFGFSAGFLLYGVIWTIAYFTLRGKVGEIVGLAVGSLVIGLVMASCLRQTSAGIRAGLYLIAGNFLGYFIGEFLWKTVGGKAGMILWAVPYGIFFGASIGMAIAEIKKSARDLALSK